MCARMHAWARSTNACMRGAIRTTKFMYWRRHRNVLLIPLVAVLAAFAMAVVMALAVAGGPCTSAIMMVAAASAVAAVAVVAQWSVCCGRGRVGRAWVRTTSIQKSRSCRPLPSASSNKEASLNPVQLHMSFFCCGKNMEHPRQFKHLHQTKKELGTSKLPRQA